MSDESRLATPVETTAVFEARRQGRARRSPPWSEVGAFDASLWLSERFEVDIPASRDAFPEERWRGRLEDLAPRGSVVDVVGQALDIWRTARRIRAIAAPTQMHAQGDDLAEASDAASGASLLSIVESSFEVLAKAPALLHAVGLDRLLEAIFWIAQRLDHSIGLWRRSGLLAEGSGGPADVPKRAFIDWLRRAGAKRVEISALLLHLRLDGGLAPGLTRNQALNDFAERRVRKSAPLESSSNLDPLRVLAWLAATEHECRRVGLDLHTQSGLFNLHPLLSVATPPRIVEPSDQSPWFWVPVPPWAMPRGDAMRDWLNGAATRAEAERPAAVAEFLHRATVLRDRLEAGADGDDAADNELGHMLTDAMRLLGVVGEDAPK